MHVRPFAAPGADPTAAPVAESSDASDADQVLVRYSGATELLPSDLRSQAD
jgi:hypothetical protein